MMARLDTHPAMLWIGDQLLPTLWIGSFIWAAAYALWKALP